METRVGWCEIVDRALTAESVPATHDVICDVCFVCNADLLHRHATGDSRRITDVTQPHAEGLWWPARCIEEGVAYGVCVDEVVVAIAYAHKTGIMPDQVADVAVCTAEPYRRRGYARAAVATLVEHFTLTGGEARYTCDIANHASAGAGKKRRCAHLRQHRPRNRVAACAVLDRHGEGLTKTDQAIRWPDEHYYGETTW